MSKRSFKINKASQKEFIYMVQELLFLPEFKVIFLKGQIVLTFSPKKLKINLGVYTFPFFSYFIKS
jgi:hypothetical protein